MSRKIIKERNEALEEHYKNFTCGHENQELRQRTIKGGSVQRICQCLMCGLSQGQALKKEKAFEITGGCEPADFDESIWLDWNDRKSAAHELIEEEYTRKLENKETEFWREYNNYLETDEWKKKREKVLLRAQGICEGCSASPATSVHHLSYEHVGEEFLFELVAVCKECHDKLHEEEDEN